MEKSTQTQTPKQSMFFYWLLLVIALLIGAELLSRSYFDQSFFKLKTIKIIANRVVSKIQSPEQYWDLLKASPLFEQKMNEEINNKINIDNNNDRIAGKSIIATQQPSEKKINTAQQEEEDEEVGIQLNRALNTSAIKRNNLLELDNRRHKLHIKRIQLFTNMRHQIESGQDFTQSYNQLYNLVGDKTLLNKLQSYNKILTGQALFNGFIRLKPQLLMTMHEKNAPMWSYVIKFYHKDRGSDDLYKQVNDIERALQQDKFIIAVKKIKPLLKETYGNYQVYHDLRQLYKQLQQKIIVAQIIDDLSQILIPKD